MNIKENGGPLEKSWRYVHHEMDEQEHSEFEQMMGADEKLRREVENIRQINSRLRELMPLTEQTEETLADQILQEWERSTDKATSNSCIKEVWTSLLEGIRNLREGWQWYPYGLRSLATVAATVLLVVGIRAYLAGPLEWMGPEIDLDFQYRGEGETERAYGFTREDILELHKTLRKSVEKQYAEMEGAEHARSWLWREKKWHLATKYQELLGGGAQVSVSLYSSRHGSLVKEWSHYYPDLRCFGNEVDGLGEQIVKELIANEPERH